MIEEDRWVTHRLVEESGMSAVDLTDVIEAYFRELYAGSAEFEDRQMALPCVVKGEVSDV